VCSGIFTFSLFRGDWQIFSLAAGSCGLWQGPVADRSAQKHTVSSKFQALAYIILHDTAAGHSRCASAGARTLCSHSFRDLPYYYNGHAAGVLGTIQNGTSQCSADSVRAICDLLVSLQHLLAPATILLMLMPSPCYVCEHGTCRLSKKERTR